MTNTTEEIIARVGNVAGEMEGELSALGKLEFAKPKKALIDADLAELRARFAELEQTYASLSKLVSNLEDEARATESGEVTADSRRLDWLNEQIVNVIDLDDGRIVDVRGLDVRAAIDAAIGEPAAPQDIDAVTGTTDDQPDPAVVEFRASRCNFCGQAARVDQFGHCKQCVGGMERTNGD